MDINLSILISRYFNKTLDVFTVEDFCAYLRKKGERFSKAQAEQFLTSSQYVFPLINKKFLTRAGAFTNQCFSFRPTKEEIKCGHFILGHRCMPFINPEISPNSINICVNGTYIPPEPERFSMNLALDLYAFYGEGYSISYILSDVANQDYKISSLSNSEIPSSIMLTSWPMNIFGNMKVEFGDRILCKVSDWGCNQVDIQLIKANPDPLKISYEDVSREDWYSTLEYALLKSFNEKGPMKSIEEQLAVVFAEYTDRLCEENCGSCEELFEHSNKISLESFGVESRLWRKGQSVPFCGSWNRITTSEELISEISQMFSPSVIDAYLYREVYKEISTKKALSEDEFVNLMYMIFPSSLDLMGNERKNLLLNIKKRHDIIFQCFNKSGEDKIADLRDYLLALFNDVSTLLCDIGCSCEKFDEFPQQDLVILIQLYSNLIGIIEEMQIKRSLFSVDDTMVSLDGMNEAFIAINKPLRNTLKKILYAKVNIKRYDKASD